MVHAMFRNYRTFCSGDFLQVFYHTWRPSLIGQAVSEKMFENNGHIYVYSPRILTDNSLGSFVCVCVCVLATKIDLAVTLVKINPR